MKDLRMIGKKIAYILRHNPGSIKMDTEGYVNVSELLSVLGVNKSVLDEVVKTDDKGRYSYDESGQKIRANQGHSIDFVNITFKEIKPPKYLYHGTSPKFVELIKQKGLLKMNRLYVHLSDNKETAQRVGKRHSKEQSPAILVIDSLKMYNDGCKFLLSDNGVWLTEYVSPEYISSIIFY